MRRTYNLAIGILVDVNSFAIKAAIFRGADKADLVRATPLAVYILDERIQLILVGDLPDRFIFGRVL